MATVDRRGVFVDSTDAPIAGDPNPGLAIKAPCLVATTGPIALSGVQAVDGLTVGYNERVLVWQQVDQTTNGLYNASTGNWTRTIDANSNDQLVHGTLVVVSSGATNANNTFELSTVDPITLGTSLINFITQYVPTIRNINTTAPLTGGGNLATDRTISIETNGIDYGLIQQVSAARLLGNPAGAAATVSEIGLGATLAFNGASLQTGAGAGDVAWAANSFATTIQPNAVTFAKFQQVTASSLVGNATAAPANATDITLGATLAFSGAALQTGAGTGDVAWAANSFATTIQPNAVSNAKFRQSAALSVVGNAGSATANVADIPGTANQVLVVNPGGTALGFGAVNLGAAAAVTGTLGAVNGGTGNAAYAIGDLLQASATTPTLSRLAAVATGNALISGGVGAVSSWGKIGLTTHITGTLAAGNGGTGATSLGVEFTVTANVFHVAPNGIGFAMLQQVAAASLVGNPTAAAANAEGITLGATLAFSGTVLETGAGGGDVAWAANSFATTIQPNAVTNAKAAQMAAATIKGNPTAATANPTDVTAAAARSSALLNIDEATPTGDANYQILSTDRMVYHTALSAPRTDTLPAAASVNAGQVLVIDDFRGVASAANTITLQTSGTDTINAVASLVAIDAQFGAAILWSDGVSRWTFFPVSTGGAGTVSDIATAGLATGGPITSTGTITVSAATQAQQIAATSATLAVTPAQQQSHPSAAKAWAMGNGGNGFDVAFNVASITLTAQGTYQIDFTTPFANAEYVVVATVSSSSATASSGTLFIGTFDKTASGFALVILNAADAGVDALFDFVCFGTQ